MKKIYQKPQIQTIALQTDCALLSLSDPHNEHNEEGAWLGGPLPSGVVPD